MAAINNLPVELVQEIASYLTPASRAALALGCKGFLKTLGSDVVRVVDNDRIELLIILEKGGEFPNQILCQQCRRFHLPRPPMDLAPMRPWQLGLSARHDARTVVAAIIRAQRLGSGLGSLSSLKKQVSYHLKERKQVRRRTCAKVVEGRLLYRTEVLITSTEKTGQHAITLDTLSMIQRREAMCPHTSWSGGTSSSNLARPLPMHQYQTYETEDAENAAKELFAQKCNLHQCLWKHPEGCECHGDSRQGVSALQGCVHCFTDYKVELKSFPSGGVRAVLLTCWRDLGSASMGDIAWDLLTPANGLSTSNLRTGTYEVGRIARGFEGTNSTST